MEHLAICATLEKANERDSTGLAKLRHLKSLKLASTHSMADQELQMNSWGWLDELLEAESEKKGTGLEHLEITEVNGGIPLDRECMVLDKCKVGLFTREVNMLKIGSTNEKSPSSKILFLGLIRASS